MGATVETFTPADSPLLFTDAAALKVKELLEEEANPSLMLRVFISGGGCSGFQYGFSLDDQRNEDDHVFNRDGVGVVVDDVSLDLLRGAEVDFVEDLIGSYFSIRNPNATSTCGCGSSFSL